MDSLFEDCLRDAVGDDAASVVCKALPCPASVSVRLNPFKWSAEERDAGTRFDCIVRQVPWSPYGLLLDGRPNFTLDPFWHAGAYYVQDSSAMFVGEVFRRCLQQLPAGEDGNIVRVLDLCAAPGGKTTDLAASLRERYGYGFILVANEVIRSRAGVLADNTALWGDPNVVVTNADPSAFASLAGFFDIIVADVPCSGEGMFRKDPEAVRQWSRENVALCQARQRRIVADVWPALKEGGVLVYSTCTFNRYENDDNVKWICENLGAESRGPGMSDFCGDAYGCGWKVMPASFGCSLLPGLVPGEGQYCAAVTKTSRAAMPSSGRASRTSNRVQGPAEWFNVPVSFRSSGTTVVAEPSVMADDVQLVSSSVRMIRSGCAAGEVKGRIVVPSADLALNYMLREDAFPAAELDLMTALAFLHRDTIVLADMQKGFVMVGYCGLPLGFVKNLGSRCNSLHPGGRRIRMDIDK